MTFAQAQGAASLVRIDYIPEDGAFDVAASKGDAVMLESEADVGRDDFATISAAAPVAVDQTYTTPDQAYAMMEPHATLAA